MTGRVDRVNVSIRRAVQRQNLPQTTAGHVLADVPFGAWQNAVAVQRSVDRDAAIVGGQAASGLYGFRLRASATRQPERAVVVIAVPNADEVVSGKIGRAPRLLKFREI